MARTRTVRRTDYIGLTNPFTPQTLFSDDAVARLHDAPLAYCKTLTRADKPLFFYARGRGQVQDCFDIILRGLDLSEVDGDGGVWAYTVINTNSPLQLDVPMAQGIIDFARAGLPW
jgi:trimethylamine:corrinoid methyltransferase-like protein